MVHWLNCSLGRSAGYMAKIAIITNEPVN